MSGEIVEGDVKHISGPVWNNHGLTSDKEYVTTIAAGNKVVDLYFTIDDHHEFIVMRHGGDDAFRCYNDTIFGLIAWCSSYVLNEHDQRDLIYRSVLRFLLNNGSFKWNPHTVPRTRLTQ